jgi:long-chain acyl-CoA synthetase
LPARLRVTSFAALQREGVASAPGGGASGAAPARFAVEAMRKAQTAADLATIIYTSGTTGLPKGVALTHENLTSNAIAALTGLPTFRTGAAETVLSFLPLTHVLARTLQYGVMWSGSSVYYGHPSRLAEDLPVVRPTYFTSVPRVLERAYERILAVGAGLPAPRRLAFDLALRLARRYRVAHPPRGGAALPYRLADRLIYRHWREAFGGRIRIIVVGGAALRPELVEVFGAAGVDVLQGYGLTESSPVIAFNRPDRNRPGTVGPVLAGTEVAIDEDGEVLARGPHIMRAYHRRPELTAAAIDAEGWLHTGDLGTVEQDDAGVDYLRITGRAKHLFKLSTGKYVMPAPLEERLEASLLVDTAVVAGAGEKYCSALLFLSLEGLSSELGRTVAAEDLGDEDVVGRLRDLVAAANRDMPAWSTVKRVALIPDALSIESGVVTPKLSIRRDLVLERYRGVLDAVYRRGAAGAGRAMVVEV